MAIITTEHDTFTKYAFFDNREWLNQENWQMYFGGSLPSGVIVKGKLDTSGIYYTSPLARYQVNQNFIQFRSGSVLINGIFAEYLGGTYIPVITSSEVDRLFVARVYLTAGTVKIVSMTKVAPEYGYTPSVFAKMLLDDESLYCVRNDTYYDIPLLYEVFGTDCYDLRRLIYLPGKSADVEINFLDSEITNTATIPDVMYGKYFLQAYGGMSYNVTFDENDESAYLYVYPIPVCSDKPISVKMVNNSTVSKQIRLPLQWKSLQFSYSWLENWEQDVNSQYIYKDLPAYDKMTIVLTPNSHEITYGYTVSNKSASSGMDPADYFTKQEVSAMLVLKADEDDMEAALNQKVGITEAGDLAYLDQVNYVTQVTNKPTLGALSAKDKAVLTTDVSGVLPVANGGSGLSSSPSLLVNLGSGSAANVMAASPRPGVTGILPVGKGGTGASSLAGLMSQVVASHTYYVDVNSGNDSTGDGSSSKPFKTIQKAVSSLIVGKINIASGTYSYNNDPVEIFGKHISIFGSNVTITSNYGVYITNSFVVFEGNFTFTSPTGGTPMRITNSTVYLRGATTDQYTFNGYSLCLEMFGGTLYAQRHVRLIGTSISISDGVYNHGGLMVFNTVALDSVYSAFKADGGVITHGSVTGGVVYSQSDMKYGAIISPA